MKRPVTFDTFFNFCTAQLFHLLVQEDMQDTSVTEVTLGVCNKLFHSFVNFSSDKVYTFFLYSLHYITVIQVTPLIHSLQAQSVK
jgi:hypothetical protein